MKQYHDLLRAIQSNGSYKEPARAGMPGSTSLFGYQNRYDLSKGFPILTTKRVPFNSIVVELLWFLRGDTNVKFLDDHGITKMWHQDAYNFYCKHACANNAEVNSILRKNDDESFSMFTFEEFCRVLRETPRHHLPKYRNYVFGDCGYQYGKVWRDWDKWYHASNDADPDHFMSTGIDQVRKVIENIRNTPYDRRKVITAVDPAHDEELALYWCHALSQFNCRKIPYIDRAIIHEKLHGGRPLAPDNQSEKFLDNVGIPKYYLDCQLYQRSADVFLGVPFNISSYCLLTHVIAKIANMIPGEFIHSFGDVHIYDNHKEVVDEILSRDPERYKLPELTILAPLRGMYEYKGLDETVKSLKPTDFALLGYESYPAIKAELSTGMKAV